MSDAAALRTELSQRVLIVDDEPSLRLVLAHALSSCGYDILFAADGETALEVFRGAAVDCVVADLSIPGMRAKDLVERIRAIDPDVALIMLIGAGNFEEVVEALRPEVNEFLRKPFEFRVVRMAVERALRHRALAREHRLHLEERVRERSEAIERLYADALLAIASAIEARDGYHPSHVERVTRRAVATGEALGLGRGEIRGLWIAGLLHDIGKIGVPDHILAKPDVLTLEEHRVIREHPVTGARLVGRYSLLQPAVPGIRHHHERWDGGGYPDGLTGEAIPLIGRILSVADSFDAIMTDRPYRSAFSPESAAAELRRCAGSQFDPRVVDAFLHAMDRDSLGAPPDLGGDAPVPLQ